MRDLGSHLNYAEIFSISTRKKSQISSLKIFRNKVKINFSSTVNKKEHKLSFLLAHNRNSKLSNQLLSWYRVKEKEIEEKTLRPESGTDEGRDIN